MAEETGSWKDLPEVAECREREDEHDEGERVADHLKDPAHPRNHHLDLEKNCWAPSELERAHFLTHEPTALSSSLEYPRVLGVELKLITSVKTFLNHDFIQQS